MRKLLILTAVAMLLTSALGCRCWRWWRAGMYNPCPPAAVYAEPAVVDPCNPCDSGAPPAVSAPVIGPGAGTYVPGPVQ